MPRYKLWLLTGALLGCLSVILGAFGAHGLRDEYKVDGFTEDELRQLENWETAARYQMYHALALLAVGFAATRRCGLAINLAGSAMTLGTLIFSGCLFVLVIAGQQWLGKIVPIGGALMIVGWLALIVALWKDRPSSPPETRA